LQGDALAPQLAMSVRTIGGAVETVVTHRPPAALPHPTDDTRLITKAASRGLELIFRAGFAFSKAEILLLDLRQRGEFTDDLFVATPPVAAERVMGVTDAINARWGRGTMRPAGVPANPDWGMRREMMSPSYTTRIDQLWTVK